MDEIRDMEVEIIEEEMDCEIPEEEEGSGIASKIVICLGVAAVSAGLGVVASKIKVKDKIEKWQADRLIKKGYVVYKPEEATPVEGKDENNAD